MFLKSQSFNKHRLLKSMILLTAITVFETKGAPYTLCAHLLVSGAWILNSVHPFPNITVPLYKEEYLVKLPDA